jgi:HPt (histidine-containing phosphotransfer) domain-containing protein
MNDEAGKLKCTDLDYLYRRTKSNPTLIMEMISLYLVQTPALVNAMKQCFLEKNWKGLYAAVHKLIPSFSIMGISADFEIMARKVQDFASNQLSEDKIPDLVLQIENVCTQACEELEAGFKTMKSTNS